MLTWKERNEVISAVRRWAQSAPDEPMLGFLAGELMTPKQLVSALELESSDGKAFLEMIEHGVRREGLDRVVARLSTPNRETGPWATSR